MAFKFKALLVLSVIVLGNFFSIRVPAYQDPSKKETVQKETVQKALVARIEKASTLLDADVKNLQNEKLGPIEDLVVDEQSGRVTHAIVGIGGFLGIGEKWCAVPWSQVKLGPDAKTFLLDTNKDKLKTAPTYDKGTIPDPANPGWIKNSNEFFGQKSEKSSSDTTTFKAVKLSDLIDHKLKSPQEEEVGKVEDAAVDVNAGWVAYLISSLKPVTNTDNQWYALPWGALQHRHENKSFVLKMDKEKLKTAQGFAKNAWPDLSDRRWGEEVHRFYGTDPYWEVAVKVQSDGEKKN